MVLAGGCLLAGLDAGLLLLRLPAPVRTDRLPEVHGMLLVLGFVGTLVALERSLALGARRGFVAPAALGLGGLALVTPLDVRIGKALLVLGAAAAVAVYTGLWRRQPTVPLLIQAGGAVAAAGDAGLWLGGVDVPPLLPWLATFVVLTVAGERLELARVAVFSPAPERHLAAAAALLLASAPAALLWPSVGTPLAGLALLALVGLLLHHDVARRTVRLTGLPRYLAGCLLAGYGWLAVAGGVWLVGGPAVDGPAYDTVVHAVFVGFTMSMILAHAPVILPAVLGRPLPYHRLLWVPAGLLHGSLLVRIGIGDARALVGGWQLGGALGVAALLLFVLTAAALTLRARP